MMKSMPAGSFSSDTFVLALPIFLASTLGWSRPAVGAFLALWIIGYGIVQAIAPAIVGGKKGQATTTGTSPPTAARLAWWTAALVLPLGGILLALRLDASATATMRPAREMSLPESPRG